MWALFIGAVFLATSLNAYPHGGSHSIPIELMKIRNVIKSKCMKNADIEAFAKLEDYILNYRNPLEGIHVPHAPSNQELVDVVCTGVRPKAYSRLSNLVEKLEPCLYQDEKYLMNVLIKTHNTSYGNDCKDGGKILYEEIAAFKSANCNVGLYSGIQEISRICLPSLNIVKNFDDVNYAWVKADFCSDVDNLRGCIADYLKTACNNDEKLMQMFNLEYSHLLSSCEEYIFPNEVE